MKLRHLIYLAKRKHAMLLAGAAICVGLVGVGATTSASTNFVDSAVYHKPSTELAEKTDLGEDLSGNRFQSSQFDSLLTHQFKESDDSDIMWGGNLPSGPMSSHDRPRAVFELNDGYVKAKSDSHMSDISDSGNKGSTQHSSLMTYSLTKHDLLLREFLMDGDNHNTLRMVKYHLHSAAKGENGSEELVFYPVEYSKKDSSITVIPKKNRSNYPMHIFVKSKKSGRTYNLLPD